MSLFCWRCLQDYQDVVFVRSYQNLSLVGPHPQEAEIIDRVQVSHHRLGWRGDAAHHPRDLGSRGVVKCSFGHDTLTWNIFIRGFQIFFIVNYHWLQSPPSPPCAAAVSSESHQAQTSGAEKYWRWSSKLFHSQSYNWLIHHAEDWFLEEWSCQTGVSKVPQHPNVSYYRGLTDRPNTSFTIHIHLLTTLRHY